MRVIPFALSDVASWAVSIVSDFLDFVVDDASVALCVAGCLCISFVIVCFSVCFFARDRSTGPPGGNQVDG